MDLSGLKWPAIILAVVAVCWLGSSGGVFYMVNSINNSTPGQDASRDKRDETVLTAVAGYNMYTLRYWDAAEVLKLAIKRYGTNGANYYYNQLRLAKCWEKLSLMQESYNIIRDLADINAKQYDGRIPSQEELRGRAERLKEVNNLQ